MTKQETLDYLKATRDASEIFGRDGKFSELYSNQLIDNGYNKARITHGRTGSLVQIYFKEDESKKENNLAILINRTRKLFPDSVEYFQGIDIEVMPIIGNYETWMDDDALIDNDLTQITKRVISISKHLLVGATIGYCSGLMIGESNYANIGAVVGAITTGSFYFVKRKRSIDNQDCMESLCQALEGRVESDIVDKKNAMHSEGRKALIDALANNQ